MTITDSNLEVLKNSIINVLRSDQLASSSVKRVEQVLRRLASQEISVDEAEAELDEISPGMGKRITDVIREKGGIAITVMLTAFGLFLAAQANSISHEANVIARHSLEFQIEQAAEQAVSQEHSPILKPDKHIKAKSGMSNASPHRTMHKNRKLRRAEEAKKRRDKRL